MILGTVRRILKEDLARSGEVPGWVDALLSPMNEFIEKVTTAISGRLTFRDNIRCKVYSEKFSSGVAKEISIPAKSRVSGVIAIDAFGQVITGYGFVRKSNGNIDMTFTHDGSDAVTCTVIILLE